MSEDEAVKRGDRIRVITEGVVRESSRTDVHFEGGAWLPIWERSTVEVLEKAPPNVGDTVTGAELQAANLPAGSVVQYHSPFTGLTPAHRMCHPDGWEFLWPEGHYIIRYIPAAA